MLFWASFLIDTDAYYIPYLIITILSFVCFYINMNTKEVTKNGANQGLIKVSAAIFSLMSILANYQICLEAFQNMTFKDLYIIILFILLSIGGFWIAYNILFCLAQRAGTFYLEKKTYKISSKMVFLLSFVVISLLNIIVLFTCKYPGALSGDSITQINECMTGNYSNHHPFYHTIIIKFFLTIGISLFGNINVAVAMYSVFQILFMGICFAVVADTLYKMNVSIYIIIAVIMWYALMPFHIMYSFTMWKDVCFGGFITLFIVYAYRSLTKIGKSNTFNLWMLFISGVGVCLFRSNGFIAFIITFIVFLLQFGKKEKKICIVFFAHYYRVFCLNILLPI